MGWTSEVTFYKLSLASFLHDLTLPSDEIAQIQTLQELSLVRNRFTQEEKENFRLHPQEAAFLVASMSEIPPDVELIVRQHHERPDGTGFPSCLHHTQLAPLSCVFIKAHAFLSFGQRSGEGSDVGSFLQQLGPAYERGNFGRIVKAIALSLNK